MAGEEELQEVQVSESVQVMQYDGHAWQRREVLTKYAVTQVIEVKFGKISVAHVV